MSILDALGIDDESLDWKKFSVCQGMPTNYFYDQYESDDVVSSLVDEACLSCPVLAQCLQAGMENSEYGVWGGIFLNAGKMDSNRNSHKSEQTWERIRERVENGDSTGG